MWPNPIIWVITTSLSREACGGQLVESVQEIEFNLQLQSLRLDVGFVILNTLYSESVFLNERELKKNQAQT